MPGDEADATARRREAVRAMMDEAWVDLGYTAPNAEVYPWLWLWDSCFHVVTWAALDEPERAVTELAAALSTIDAAGFVPHMGYQLDPDHHADLWLSLIHISEPTRLQ